MNIQNNIKQRYQTPTAKLLVLAAKDDILLDSLLPDDLAEDDFDFSDDAFK